MMPDQRIVRLPGSRPNGSSRNGMPDFAGYRFKGTEDWDPFRGVHRDPEAVRERPAPAPGGDPLAGARTALAAKLRAERLARMAECARLLESGMSPRQAAAAMGVGVGTVYDYQREMRGWGGEA